MTARQASRRAFLTAACGGCAAVLGGCATYGESSAQVAEPVATQTSPAGGPAGGSAPAALASVSDIPVGGGTVFAAQKVVVTQPQAGTIRAFSAVCTHQGCAVSTVAEGTINCTCHGSRFAITDGSVANGPARQPLPPVDVTVTGDTITLA